MVHTFEKSSNINAPAERVFAFHERPDALEKLIPPGQPVHVVEHTGGIRNGGRVVLKIGFWPVFITWVARHQNYIAGREFQDVQERGPFKSWSHTHTVTATGPESCTLTDHVDYEAFGAWFIERMLRRTFAYRHRVTIRETTKT